MGRDAAANQAFPEIYAFTRLEAMRQKNQALLRDCQSQLMTQDLRVLLEESIETVRNEIGVSEFFTQQKASEEQKHLTPMEAVGQSISESSRRYPIELQALTQALRLFPDIDEPSTETKEASREYTNISEFEQQLRHEPPLVYTEDDFTKGYHAMDAKRRQMQLDGATEEELQKFKERWDEISGWSYNYDNKVPLRWKEGSAVIHDVEEAGRLNIVLSHDYIAAGLDHPDRLAAQAVAANQPLSLYTLAHYISKNKGPVEPIITIQKEKFGMTDQEITYAQDLAQDQINRIRNLPPPGSNSN